MATSSVLSRQRRSPVMRSEEHTSELQSQSNLVCRLLLEKKKKTQIGRAYGRHQVTVKDTMPSYASKKKKSKMRHTHIDIYGEYTAKLTSYNQNTGRDRQPVT